MDKSRESDKVSELDDFYYQLLEYTSLLERLLHGEKLTKAEQKRHAEVYEDIGRKVGYLGPLITELTGIDKVDVHGKEYDMWLIGLRIDSDSLAASALGFCIQATNRAIGKLEDDIKNGIRDKETGLLVTPQTKMTTEAPKAFIAHGGRSGILDKLREFIEALGIKPIIVELSPTRGMTVDEKVNKHIKDADCGIVLATKGGIVDTTGTKPKQHPRLNVIDELERLRAAFPEKTILLVERGVDLPSNISGLTYEPFVGQSMDRAFTAIARELTEFGILKATKPQE